MQAHPSDGNISNSAPLRPSHSDRGGRRNKPRRQCLMINRICGVCLIGVEPTIEAHIELFDLFSSRFKAALKQGIKLKTLRAIFRDQAESQDVDPAQQNLE